MLTTIFRFRRGLHLVIYLAAFAITYGGAGRIGVKRVWLSLPAGLSANFGIGLQAGIVGVTAGAILFAFAGAALRTWGTAYLGAGVVFDPTLQGGRIAVDGPYRFIRNPLYVGTMLHTVALTVLMSWIGAVFCLAAILALQIALVVSEERFLAAQMEQYAAYAQAVPRFFPRLSHPAAGLTRPRWAQAFGAEIYMWGAALSFAMFGFTYNALLVLQGVMVAFGISIVSRGFMAKR